MTHDFLHTISGQFELFKRFIERIDCRSAGEVKEPAFDKNATTKGLELSGTSWLLCQVANSASVVVTSRVDAWVPDFSDWIEINQVPCFFPAAWLERKGKLDSAEAPVATARESCYRFV